MGAGAVQAPGLVDLLDHLLGVGDAVEAEAVVARAGGVEVDVADLDRALEQGLVVVDVLDPLQARLLDLAGDDPALYVQAAVGDRVDGRDPLQKADQDGQRQGHQDDQEDEAVVGVVAEDPGRERDHDPRCDRQQQALCVEGEDCPPGRVTLEDHSFAGGEVQGHRESILAATLGVRARP